MDTPSSDSNHDAPQSTLSETVSSTPSIKQAKLLVAPCTSILRLSLRIQSTLITNTYRVRIMIPAMCPDLLNRTSSVDFPIPYDIKMVTDVTEATVMDVIQTAGFRRKEFPFRRGTAMNDNQCNSPHQSTYNFVHRAARQWR